MKNQADIFVAGHDMATAMNGDTVKVQLAKVPQIPQAAGHAREGRIVEVVERANSKVVGIYSASRRFGFVVPDDTRLKNDIYVPEEASMGAATGAKVVVEITQWPEGNLKAEGRIIEVLGQRVSREWIFCPLCANMICPKLSQRRYKRPPKPFLSPLTEMITLARRAVRIGVI